MNTDTQFKSVYDTGYECWIVVGCSPKRTGLFETPVDQDWQFPTKEAADAQCARLSGRFVDVSHHEDEAA